MDRYGQLGQRRDAKHKGRNVVWSNAMDTCLIESLAIEARNGNKIDKCFNENAYTSACYAVNSRFGLNLNNQKVVNRLKTIKKRYNVMKDLLSQDGFWLNPRTQMVECEHDEDWKRYIAARPDAKRFREKRIEMYDELKIVCGNYQAPSRWAKLRGESVQPEMKNFEDNSTSFASPSSEDLNDSDGTESYTGPQDYSSMPGGNQDRKLPKRPRSSEDLRDAMLAIASSVRRLADAMDRSRCSFQPSDLLQAVMEIDGLDEARKMYAFEYLNAEPVKARAFLAYDARLRRMYLFRQFWWWK